MAFIEGVTTLALFVIAMPMKYLAGNPEPVRITGWMHGIAFLAYVVMMWVALHDRGWRPVELLRTFVASLFPFGTFLNDPWLKTREGTGLVAKAASRRGRCRAPKNPAP